MIRRNGRSVLFALGLTLAAWAQPAAQTPSQLENTLTHAGPFEGKRQLDAFLSVLFQFDLPAAIIWRPPCDGLERFSFQFSPQMSLAQALDSIVAAGKYQYQWTVGDGVINIMPAEGLPPLLSTRIDVAAIPDAANLSLSLDQLRRLPEVEEATNALGMRPGTNRGGGIHSLKPPASVPLEIENMRLLDAINLLAKTHGQAIWMYTEYRCTAPPIEYTFEWVRR